ncbi:DNA polymerase epsilon, partial [Spraguea lophii 42_110]
MQDSLFEKFGYELYAGDDIEGWLFNYNIEKLPDSSLIAILYFITEKGNVYCKIPFYPHFLVESDNLDADEETLKRKYFIEKIERVYKKDLSKPNHINEEEKEYLKVYFYNENNFLKTVKDLKCKKKNTNTFSLFYDKERKESGFIILEYDIAYEILLPLELNVRVGKWYHIKNNIFHESSKIEFPKLKIMAFDIETTKSPLKFPTPEKDQIMMISLSFGDEGLLITNRNVVSEDIRPFEYCPKEDISGKFDIANEKNEELLLLRFLRIIQEKKPNILTTFNGNFFDFPFIEKRLQKYGLDISDIGIVYKAESYTSNFIIHLDCFRWVQRDSYLPMGSQGLKKVTQIKLGYFPDEIDPEEMVGMAKSDPDKLASYSVSDAVATYFLYMKYVHPFIFSLSSLIPYPSFEVLSKGSGTLCEALLISEALNRNIIIPSKKKEGDNIFYYKDGVKYLAENLSYIGGHVECLKTGIYREDFEYGFSVELENIEKIKQFIKENYEDVDKHLENIDQWIKDKSESDDVKRTKRNKLIFNDRPYIYHLDVGAMYPNIILTHKLQPTGVVTEDHCIKCDFYSENSCKKKMKWKLRANYYPATLEEYKMIGLNIEDKENINKIKEYNKNIYGKLSCEDIVDVENIVCQREDPFFVDTVRKFRDQRYYYKNKLKELKKEKNPNNNLLIVFESLQVAHKVILNSFYGYAMRKGSRWYSMEMAAMVCNVGGAIIKTAREWVDNIGITLELDTDGIWCLVPQSFNWIVNNKNILKDYLNRIMIENFTNHEYQERIENTNTYKIKSVNSIEFELDGPYKAMILPSSIEKGKNIKKKYVVINMKNKISELKGFEFKRRGELNLIKKFQEEIFNSFTIGSNLQECYKELENITRDYLCLINNKGEDITDDEIFHMFSESKNMSKTFYEYEGRKTLSTVTLKKLSDIIGDEILNERNIKCEFIISKYPFDEPVANRTIPTIVFSVEEEIRKKILKKWIKKNIDSDDIRELIDWSYYKQRLETVILKIIKIPAWKQNINILEEVEVPDWIKKHQKNTLEDYFILEENKEEKNVKNNLENVPEPLDLEKINTIDLNTEEYKKYILNNKNKWVELFEKTKDYISIVKIEIKESIKIFYLHKDTNQYKEIEKYYILLFNNKYVLVSKQEYEEKKEYFNHYLIQDHRVIDPSYFMVDTNNKIFKKLFDMETKLPINTDIKNHHIIFLISLDNKILVKDRKTYILTKNKKEIKNKKVEVRECNIKREIKKVIKNKKIIIVSKKDQQIKQLIPNNITEYIILELNTERKITVGLDEEYLFKELNFLENEYNRLQTISSLGIPLANIDNNLLDILYFHHLNYDNYQDFKEIKDLRVYNSVTSSNNFYLEKILKDEYFREGFYNSTCVEIELQGILILTIINKENIITEIKNIEEFNKLKTFILTILRDNRYLLPIFNQWITKESKFISRSLRKELILLKQKYIIELVSKISELGCKIVSVNKEIIILNINKKEGIKNYIKYISSKISKYIKIKILRIFEKLIYLSPIENFYLKKKNNEDNTFNDNNKDKIYENNTLNDNKDKIHADNNKIYEDTDVVSFNSCNIPKRFLVDIFNNNVDNNYLYSLALKNKNIDIPLLLKIYSFISDKENVRSNIYKLLKRNEFADDEEYIREYICMDIECICGSDNILRIFSDGGRIGSIEYTNGIVDYNKCNRCYGKYSLENIEEVIIKYLNNKLIEYFEEERICSRCKDIKKNRINNKCGCGGIYKIERNREFLDVIR